MRFCNCACWSWTPMRCCSALAFRAGSRPSTEVRPASALRTPSMHSMVVVLPAPLGPMSPKISPSNTSKETSSTATVEPYSLRRWATSMTRLPDAPADCGGGGEVSRVGAGGRSRGGMGAHHSLTPRQAQVYLWPCGTRQLLKVRLRSCERPATRKEIASSDAHSEPGVPMQWLECFGQGTLRDLADGHAVFPVRRADGDEARVATRPALALGESDHHQGTRLRHLIQVRHSLGLGVPVLEKPGLPLERGSRIGIQRLMPMEQDVALLVKALEGCKGDARERSPGRQVGRGPIS